MKYDTKDHVQQSLVIQKKAVHSTCRSAYSNRPTYEHFDEAMIVEFL